jgi:hypothetical protein
MRESVMNTIILTEKKQKTAMSYRFLSSFPLVLLVKVGGQKRRWKVDKLK